MIHRGNEHSGLAKTLQQFGDLHDRLLVALVAVDLVLNPLGNRGADRRRVHSVWKCDFIKGDYRGFTYRRRKRKRRVRV